MRTPSGTLRATMTLAYIIRWLDDTRRDLAYATRALLRARAFSAAAVATLAVGIGAATTIYSVVDAIMLRPLPFPHSDRLVRIVENVRGATGQLFPRGVSYRDFLEWRARTQTLADAAAIVPLVQSVRRPSGGSVNVFGAMVSPNAFALLGSRTWLGRTLEERDATMPDVVVLTFDAWQRLFDGAPAIVGTAIEFRAGQLPPRPVTMVGVLAPDFDFRTDPLDLPPNFYMPMRLDPSRPSPLATVIALVREGVSLEAATQEADIIGRAVSAPRPAGAPALPGPRFAAVRVKDQIIRDVTPALRVLLAAVAIVLLTVCANVASLLLARGSARERESAIRAALGASRARITRHVFAECAVLALAGGALGAALAAGGVVLVKQLATLEAPGVLRLVFGSTILPRATEIVVDIRMLGVAFGLATLTALMFGTLPALRASRANHLAAGASRGSSATARDVRVRDALVVGQLVMATVLLIGAGLLVRSFVKLSSVPTGFNPDNVLTFQLVVPSEYSPARRADAIDAILTRLRAEPDVEAAGFARHGVLITEQLFMGTFVPQGRTADRALNEPRLRVRSVSPGFMRAMGIGVVSGRELDPSDDAGATPALVFNRLAARQLFGAEDPVGRLVDWRSGTHNTPATVVGVVDDVRNESIASEPYPEVFVDYRRALTLLVRWGEANARQNEFAIGFLSFAVRTKGDPASRVPIVRRLVTSLDPNIVIDSIVPMTRMVANSVARQRFSAILLALFAGVAALLAIVGIYGILAYGVAQRTREIGLRVALGMSHSRAMLMILAKGVMLGAMGIAIGLVVAATLARSLQALLFGVAPLDATTFAFVAAVFTLVAAMACYLPARRATKIDPVVALRCE